MKKIVFLFFLNTSIGFAQIITTIAGNGISSYGGDGGPAINASFSEPQAVAVDAIGNVYIVDEDDNVIRKVNTSGIIKTIAGNGTIGFNGDNGPATSAKMTSPSGICLDTAGNIYIADTYNHVVRFVNVSTGIITTIAGKGGFNGFTGDGGLAVLAELNLPEGVAIDRKGNLYIADAGNNKIRIVDTAGIISSFAGSGVGGYGGDGGLATAAKLNYPISVLADTASDKIYIGDINNNRVRVIDALGIISTFAGTGTAAFSGDGAQATSAALKGPNGVTIDTSGTVYIADAGNNRIRKVNLAGIITTYVGNGTAGFSGDGGPAISAKIFAAPGITVDIRGNLYIAEYYNSRVRKVSYCSNPLNLTISGTFSICAGDSTLLNANGATTYTWSANTNTASTSSVTVTPTDTSNYIVTGASGSCIAVDSVTVNVILCSTNIKEVERNIATVYPNPTTGLLFIQSTENGKTRIEVYNSIGEKVFSNQMELQINISHLSAGIYFVRILKDNLLLQQSIIIKR